MTREVRIGNRWVGDGHPTYIVAEIGINHSGDLETARRLIDAAVHAGVDAVKLQKRTPELSVPPDQQTQMRDTPWGYITYLEYRHHVEFGREAYAAIDVHCREKEVDWFVSVWDEPSVDFMEAFDPPCYKIPSASLTDESLLRRLRQTGRPLILSTGMSTMEQIERAVALLDRSRLLLTHATSSYPCEPEELNLRAIETLRRKFEVPVGYSGHEVGPDPFGRGRRPGRLPGRAPHHARPRAVGQRPGGLRRAGGFRAVGEVHPSHRAGPGGRRQTCLRQRGRLAAQTQAGQRLGSRSCRSWT